MPFYLEGNSPLEFDENNLSSDKVRSMSLQDCFSQALGSSRILKDLGVTVLRAPQAVGSNLDPAIVYSDPRIGEEAALSAFDANLFASTSYEDNDRGLNNQFFGVNGNLRQDLSTTQTGVNKRSATGGLFTVRNVTVYDRNNQQTNRFGVYSWENYLEAQVRQPLMQGAGSEFNRIAGPGSTPGQFNGVLLARVRTDTNLVEFEKSVRDYLADVENAYWDLYYAYRDLDARIDARNIAANTFEKLDKKDAAKGRLAQAEEQVHRFQSEIVDSLNGRVVDGTRNNNGSTGGTFRGSGGVRVSERMHRRVVSQEKAISAISRAIRRSRAGLKNPNRPVGSFIFLGPTGVGKTELARALANFLFGTDHALIRFDMSEYMEKHSVSKLIGSPPGYVGHEEGGQLTEKVKRSPYSVVLLDEVEKAHPDVFNILLQVFEDGHLTDGLGNRVNFKNTIIIMTSNIGARFIQKKSGMGFQSSDSVTIDKSVSDMVLGEVKRTFNPEFINRIDEIIVFEALTDADLRLIMGLLVQQINDHLVDRKLTIALSPEVIDWIIDVTCKDRSYGARPLRRAIQRYVEDPLSEELIRGHLRGGAVEVYLEAGVLAYRPSGQLEAGRKLA